MFIDTNNQLPGIINLLKYRPESGRVLSELADTLLRTMKSTLTLAEREFVFTVASFSNDCEFDAGIHQECTIAHMTRDGNTKVEPTLLMKGLRALGPCSMVEESERQHQLAHLAFDVATMYGLQLRQQMEKVHTLLANVLSDQEIHDAVLIASTACLFNRYVDALGAPVPTHDGFYKEIGQELSTKGYQSL